jgi:hypothetical protein
LDGGNTGGSVTPTGGTTGSGGIGATGGTGPDASAGSGGQSPNPDGGVVTPDGSVGTPDGGDASGDGSGDAATSLPPPGTLWNDGVLNPATAVLVCFTTAPHIEWNGKRRCDGQATANLSCSGDPFTGTDVASLRDRFMALMQDTWSRATNLEFFAHECPTDGGVVDTTKLPNQLAVTFVTKGADSEPLTEDVTGLGKHDFASDLHVDWKGLLANDPEALRTILRESGRILGFPYEWLRGSEATAPQACPSTHTPDPDFDFLARPGALVDFFSVTDRCTPTSSTQPGLSPGDVIGAQQTYGIKQNGGLVGYRGYCADVAGANTATGSAVIGFPCRSAGNDSFCRCSQSVAQFEASFGNQQRCLAVSGNAVSSSFTPVVSNACDGSLDGQKFSVSNVEWRALGNMCLTANNGKIELAFCDGSAAQKWNFWDVDTGTTPTWDQIQHASTGDCVTTQTLDGGYGEQLGLASCSAADVRQHFQYRGEGFIAFSGSNLWCMNVLGGTLAPGSPLGLWDGCNYRPFFNSQFHVSGSFKSLGQCLSMQDKPGTFPDVGVEPCTAGARREVWDFHF